MRDVLYRRVGGVLPDEDENHGIVENWDAFRKTGTRRALDDPADAVNSMENLEAFRKGRKRGAPETVIGRNLSGSWADAVRS